MPEGRLHIDHLKLIGIVPLMLIQAAFRHHHKRFTFQKLVQQHQQNLVD